MSDAGKPSRRRLPAEGRQPAGRAGEQEGPHHHHRQRRDPRLDGAVASASSRTRSPASCATPGSAPSKTGDFYGQCAELCGKEHAYMPIHVKVLSQPDYTAWVDGEKKEMAAKADDPNKVWTLADLDGARREGLRRQLRGLPPAQRQGRRPDQAARRLAGRARRRQEQAARRSCSTAPTTARCRRGSSCRDTEIAAVITFTKNTLVEQDRPARAAGRSRGRPQVIRHRTKTPRNDAMSAVLDHGHARTTATTTTSTTAIRTAGGAGCSRPTTRTSARCTCCSRSPC